MIGPVGGLQHCGSQNPAADLADQPAFFGKRDELVGRNPAADRVLPAHECLEPGDFLARGSDDRLVANRELVALHRLTEVVFEQLAVACLGVHRGFVEAMLASARGLCGVEGEVGVANEAVGAGPVRFPDGDPDRRPDGYPMPFDFIDVADFGDQPFGERSEEADVDRSGDDRLELVPAQASDLAMFAQCPGQSAGDPLQQRIADGMAERIVDVLEAVEVDQEQRATALAPSCAAQRLVEGLAHHHPVGQRSQRIELREPGNFALRSALLGQVGANAAKAEEAAAVVENGIARERPVDVLVARRSDHHVGKGKAGGQIEAERSFLAERIAGGVPDRQEIVELPAEQSLGSGFEVVGELLADVGQCPGGIGFPEPAATRRFEFGDEIERLARQIIELEAAAGGGNHGPGDGDAIRHRQQGKRSDTPGHHSVA